MTADPYNMASATQQNRAIVGRNGDEVKRTIGAALRDLPNQQRLVTLMCSSKDRMSYAEIGLVLDIHPDEAQRLYQQAKRTIKSALETH